MFSEFSEYFQNLMFSILPLISNIKGFRIYFGIFHRKTYHFSNKSIILRSLARSPRTIRTTSSVMMTTGHLSASWPSPTERRYGKSRSFDIWLLEKSFEKFVLLWMLSDLNLEWKRYRMYQRCRQTAVPQALPGKRNGPSQEPSPPSNACNFVNKRMYCLLSCLCK